jgi:hypothetical protein
MGSVVSEIQFFKNWVFFPKSEKVIFTSLILLNTSTTLDKQVDRFPLPPVATY